MPKQKAARRYRALLPASQQSPEPFDQDVNSGGSKRTRHRLTQVACDACRSRKTRCCGSRPVCEQCKARNSECVYLSKDRNETRSEALKRECDTLRQNTYALQSFIDRLRDEPEDVAQATLIRLRAEGVPLDTDASLPDLDSSTTLDGQDSDQLHAVSDLQPDPTVYPIGTTALALGESILAYEANGLSSQQRSHAGGAPALTVDLPPTTGSSAFGSSLRSFTFPQGYFDSSHARPETLRAGGDMGMFSGGGTYTDDAEAFLYPVESVQPLQRGWNG